VNGDTQQFTVVKVQLLSELISTAMIRLDATTLPDEAKDVRIPQLSELPIVLMHNNGRLTVGQHTGL